LPAIGAAAGAAVYAEGGGRHTASGYLIASGEGLIGGVIGSACEAGFCTLAGNAVVGGILANGLWGAIQGVWDYERNEGYTTPNGYLSAGEIGFAEGGFPWDQLWKVVRNE
jgi:hypothetical protein